MRIDLKCVEMTNGSNRLKLESPYHPSLPHRLKALGGKWNADMRAWYLPADLEDEVRRVCVEIYGIDPKEETETVDIRFYIGSREFKNGEFWDFGRQILRRPGRDMPVSPGEGVSIVDGEFPRSGGSRNNPAIGTASDRTALIVRNVPVRILKRMEPEDEACITVLEDEHGRRSQDMEGI